MPNFDRAAQRHYREAVLLRNSGRAANADHLAGFAAECALKAILLRFLGAQLNAKGRPVSSVSGRNTAHGHLPKLWDEAKTVVAGRAAATTFAGFLAGGNPFQSWDVSDRYEDGSQVKIEEAERRVEMARRVVSRLQMAKLSGGLR